MGARLKEHLLSVCRSMCKASAGLALLAVVVLAAALGAHAQPTPESYLRDNPHAQLIGAKGFEIDEYRVVCGSRPLIVDHKFDSWGGAYPGFMIWNPDMSDKLPTAVKLYIFSHECGHQFVGRDEQAADCFAIRRGRRQGWLKDDGMDEICNFISKSVRADDEHAGGHARCDYMRVCYAQAAPKGP